MFSAMGSVQNQYLHPAPAGGPTAVCVTFNGCRHVEKHPSCSLLGGLGAANLWV